ncbi:Uncharacterized protein BM_BM13257 [Brugia malayi]|uniref:Bm13257 n=2 Tax=Brugia TaxID=6278 RepID=A0A0K0IXA1_BRUMA|nr:Uncharacterized protein BM_BM13257 [Brugia malayi]CDP95013.1 Bm13257 [Brugia malayi]VDN91058.1 unnamed protein product [Brugia pahangi]VIO87132.1 Uncharacterized protein BM_BM13257 [Brugia malayi]
MNEHSSTYLPSNVLDAIRNTHPISTYTFVVGGTDIRRATEAKYATVEMQPLGRLISVVYLVSYIVTSAGKTDL